MMGTPKLPTAVTPPPPPVQVNYLKATAPGLAATGGGKMGNTYLTAGMPGMPSTSGQKSLLGG